MLGKLGLWLVKHHVKSRLASSFGETARQLALSLSEAASPTVPAGETARQLAFSPSEAASPAVPAGETARRLAFSTGEALGNPSI